MRATTNHDDTSRGGRRADERRKVQEPFEAPEQRDAERRSGNDRRQAPRVPLD